MIFCSFLTSFWHKINFDTFGKGLQTIIKFKLGHDWLILTYRNYVPRHAFFKLQVLAVVISYIKILAFTMISHLALKMKQLALLENFTPNPSRKLWQWQDPLYFIHVQPVVNLFSDVMWTFLVGGKWYVALSPSPPTLVCFFYPGETSVKFTKLRTYTDSWIGNSIASCMQKLR